MKNENVTVSSPLPTQTLLTTELQQAKQQVIELEQALAKLKADTTSTAIAENLPDMLARVNREHRYIYVNQAAAALSGKTPTEIIGKTNQELGLPSDKIELWSKAANQVFESGQEVVIDYDFKLPSGLKYYQSRLVPERNSTDTIESVLCITRDISSLKAAEVALEQRERRYRTLAENSPDIIIRFDRDKKYIYLNPSIKNLTGRPPEFYLGKIHQELGFDPKDYSLWEETVDKAIETGQIQLIEFDFEAGGSRYYYQSRYVPEFAVDNTVESVLVIAHNITKLKEAENALAAEKERLSVTLDAIADGVVATDIDGKIALINPIAQKLSGWSEAEALGKTFDEVLLFKKEDKPIPLNLITQRILQRGEAVASNGTSGDIRLISRNGSERIIEGKASPILTDDGGQMLGVVLVFSDVTNQRKIEDELQKTDKLDAVGILAGGIAHDFNNFLTAVQGNVALVKRSLKGNEAAAKHLTDAETACIHARSLTQQLLTFSRGGTPVKKVTLAGDLVRTSADFAVRGSQVRCECEIAPDLWPVEIDTGQISRVINNLVINAQQAMPGGGVIRIAAQNVRISHDTLGQQIPLPAGNYIEITVQDQGIGIPKEYLSRIFDPYFTTKQQGNGLGLAVSYSIIRNHDGYVIVESELGVGSTFSIYLPSSLKDISRTETETIQMPTSKLKVLVMDDQELIVELIHDLLTEEGHAAVTAKDGVEAIARYLEAKESGQPFDVVIMDLTIPGGMGGKETMQRLLEIDSHTRAIVSSGYSNDPITANYKNYGFAAVVAKPFDLDELLQVIQDVAKK